MRKTVLLLSIIFLFICGGCTTQDLSSFSISESSHWDVSKIEEGNKNTSSAFETEQSKQTKEILNKSSKKNLETLITHEPTVASEDKTVTLENSSVSSVAMNPYVSRNERGEIIYINPAEEIFNNNDEIPEYLKRIDLREKGFDIIANEKIYLTPHIINSPKSRIGKTDIINTEISTAQGGGFL